MKRAKWVGLAFLMAACGALAQAPKPRLAVKTFENPANDEKSTIGNALTEIVITELGKTGKYSLIERGAIDQLTKEIDFGSTDWAKADSFAKKGGLAGVEYFLLGKVTNFSYREQAAQEQVYVQGVARYVTVYYQQADVRVDFRVVKTGTGEIKLTESGVGQRANKSTVSWSASWNLLLSSASLTGEFMDSLMGRATMAAVGDVVRKLNTLAAELPVEVVDANAELLSSLSVLEGRVLGEVGPDMRIVSLGKNQGLVIGDRLKVFYEEVIKNKAGKEVYRERREGGLLEVVDISMADRSRARLLVDPKDQVPGRALEGDIIAVDVEHAEALRRMAAAKVGSEAENANAEASENYLAALKRGDRYLEDQLYSQALEQFRKADALRPGVFEVMNRIATVHLLQRDYFEAEVMAEKMIEQGHPLEIPVLHDHAMTLGCEGQLQILRGTLRFRAKKGDHSFEVAPSQLIRVEEGFYRKRNLIGAPQGDAGLPWLAIEFRGADGKDKKMNFYPLGFYQFASGSRTLAATPEQAADTLKYVRALARLVNKYRMT